MRRITIERSAEAGLSPEPYEETLLVHSWPKGRNTIEARLIIGMRDKNGNEWEYNDVRKIKLRQVKP